MKNIFLFVAISFFINSSFSQNRHFVYVDVLPALTKTAEIGYEYHISPYLSTTASLGYVFNTRLGNVYGLSSQLDLTNKSGAFFKTGIQFNIRKKISHFAPVIGINFVNAYAIEEGELSDWESPGTKPEYIKKNSYNLAFNGIIGIASPAKRQFSFELGMQIGTVLINNTLGYDSYVPGTGLKAITTIQGILKVKFRIIPFKI